MTRHERDRFFESIVRLREQYGHLPARDRAGMHPIDDVVRWAEAQMSLVSIEATAATPGDSEAR